MLLDESHLSGDKCATHPGKKMLWAVPGTGRADLCSTKWATVGAPKQIWVA